MARQTSGTSQDDELYGDQDVDFLEGGEGDDRLYGGSGADTLEGGLGSDRIEGGAGDDTMTGDLSASTSSRDTFVFAPGHGNDTITDFGAGGDVIDLSAFSGIAGLGDLSITVERDAIVIDLTAHDGGTIRLQNFDIDDLDTDDFVFSDEPDEDGSGAGTPQITHLAYNMEGDDEGDTLEGAGGNDTISGEGGSDLLYGHGGDDVIEGGEGNDWLEGGAGNDTLEGGEGVDTLYGGTGDDTLKGGAGDDTLEGGEGVDTLEGNKGDDTLSGDAGDDYLYGSSGTDTLDGGEGIDWLFGGEGDDRLEGGADNDVLHGGEGADTFVFNSGDGSDTLVDFTDGEDVIDLSAMSDISGFSDLTITQNGDNAVIDFSAHGGGMIVLRDVDAADLDADDFTFTTASSTDSDVDGM